MYDFERDTSEFAEVVDEKLDLLVDRFEENIKKLKGVLFNDLVSDILNLRTEAVSGKTDFYPSNSDNTILNVENEKGLRLVLRKESGKDAQENSIYENLIIDQIILKGVNLDCRKVCQAAFGIDNILFPSYSTCMRNSEYKRQVAEDSSIPKCWYEVVDKAKKIGKPVVLEVKEWNYGIPSKVRQCMKVCEEKGLKISKLYIEKLRCINYLPIQSWLEVNPEIEVEIENAYNLVNLRLGMISPDGFVKSLKINHSNIINLDLGRYNLSKEELSLGTLLFDKSENVTSTWEDKVKEIKNDYHEISVRFVNGRKPEVLKQVFGSWKAARLILQDKRYAELISFAYGNKRVSMVLGRALLSMYIGFKNNESDTEEVEVKVKYDPRIQAKFKIERDNGVRTKVLQIPEEHKIACRIIEITSEKDCVSFIYSKKKLTLISLEDTRVKVLVRDTAVEPAPGVDYEWKDTHKSRCLILRQAPKEFENFFASCSIQKGFDDSNRIFVEQKIVLAMLEKINEM